MKYRSLASGLAGLAAVIAGLAAGPVSAAGALVSSPVKGSYIYMTHRPSPGYAADLAMSDCMSKYGGGCRLLTTYGSGCIAIAHAEDGTHHSGWAVKTSLQQARLYALGQCAKYGGPCALDVQTCE